MRAASAAAVLLAAAAASASPPPSARLNGREVRADAPLALRAGDRLETGEAPVELRTAAGTAAVSPSSVLSHQGTERGVEYLFLVRGTAEGDLGPGTALGTSAAWAVAPDPRPGLPVPRIRLVADASGRESRFRSLAAGAWLRFHAVSTWLPERCEADVAPSADGPGSLRVAAAPANRAPVEVLRVAGDRAHAAVLPPGVSGSLAEQGAVTRIVCREAPDGTRLRAESRRDGKAVAGGSAGPGAALRVEGETIRAEIPALGPGVLEALLRQDVEFAPLGVR